MKLIKAYKQLHYNTGFGIKQYILNNILACQNREKTEKHYFLYTVSCYDPKSGDNMRKENCSPACIIQST